MYYIYWWVSYILYFQVLPFSDDLCLQEPCLNFEECLVVLKFRNVSNFVATESMLFRSVHPWQSKLSRSSIPTCFMFPLKKSIPNCLNKYIDIPNFLFRFSLFMSMWSRFHWIERTLPVRRGDQPLFFISLYQWGNLLPKRRWIFMRVSPWSKFIWKTSPFVLGVCVPCLSPLLVFACESHSSNSTFIRMSLFQKFASFVNWSKWFI